MRDAVGWLRARWLGRILVSSVATCMRVEIFDRATTIAAQFFTSVIPVLILTATWAGGGDGDSIADALGVPAKSRAVVEQAVEGADSAAFGIAGALLVLASATSLSRALTRAFAAIWDFPRPRSKLTSAWRWLAAVLVLTVALLLVHSLSEHASVLPPRQVWPFAISFVCDLAVATFVPWVLLSGTISPDSSSRRRDVRPPDARDPPGLGDLAPAGARDQRRPLRGHRSGLHLPGVAVRRRVLLPGDRSDRPGHRHRPRAARRPGPARSRLSRRRRGCFTRIV